MKRLPLLLLSAVLVLSGCSSVKSRIEERSTVFAALDASAQDKIRKGEVDVGFTPDMVYMALGNPDVRHEKLQAAGVKLTWIYNSYYQEYQGTATGFHRRLVYYPPTHSYILVVEPVTTDVYADKAEEKVRVEFVNGKVAAIEQGKDEV